MAKPIWQWPKGYNFNEHDGREAFLAGEALDSHGAGESLRAREFEAAWRRESQKAVRTS